MKTIYLVRHAKSSWDSDAKTDMERPLNSRGLRDAPFMAKLLKGKGVEPDAFISSPATRAMTTATFFKNELAPEGKKILVNEDIYEAMSATIVKIIHELPDDLETVLLFGHNPTFTSVANLFSSELIWNMPTCAIARIDSPTNSWANFQAANAALSEYHYPKLYL